MKGSARIWATAITGSMLIAASAFLIAEIQIASEPTVSRGLIASNHPQFMFFLREIQVTDPDTKRVLSCYFTGLLRAEYAVGTEVSYKGGRSLAVIPSLLFNILFPPALIDGLALFVLLRVLFDVITEARASRRNRSG